MIIRIALSCLPIGLAAEDVAIRDEQTESLEQDHRIYEKRRLWSMFDYMQIHGALLAAVKEHPVVDGVDISRTTVGDVVWDWRMDLPYAPPRAGDWTVVIDSRIPKKISFTVRFDPKTKVLSRIGDGLITLRFEVISNGTPRTVQFLSAESYGAAKQ